MKTFSFGCFWLNLVKFRLNFTLNGRQYFLLVHLEK